MFVAFIMQIIAAATGAALNDAGQLAYGRLSGKDEKDRRELLDAVSLAVAQEVLGEVAPHLVKIESMEVLNHGLNTDNAEALRRIKLQGATTREILRLANPEVAAGAMDRIEEIAKKGAQDKIDEIMGDVAKGQIGETRWAEMREAQKTLKRVDEEVGAVVSVDFHEANNGKTVTEVTGTDG